MKKALRQEDAASKRGSEETAATGHAGKHHAPTASRSMTFDPDTLLDSMDGMVYVAAPDYRIEYMNDAALRRVGRDMTGKRCFKVFHGFDEPCPWCVAALVRQGQTFRQEIQGQIDRRWYTSVLTPLSRRDGTVSVQALVFDVTDQKRAEAALLQSEALLRNIMQTAPAGIGMVRDRVIEWTNEQVSRITGYSPEELRGKSARILYPSDEEFDRVGRHKYAEIQSRGTGSIVTIWQRRDGQTVHIFLNSTPVDPGDLSTGVVFTALDITEKKRALDELWRSEEKYRTLFENAVMGIFQSTPEGRFLSVNPATATMCGFDSPAEMVASITDIASQHYVDPAERDLFIRTIEEQGFVRNFEHRTYRKDGSVFWVSVNARAVQDKRSRITHYEGTHEDIQRRKEAEEDLRASEERFVKVFQSNPIPMTIATLDEGRLIDVNERAIELSGYSREELIGRTSVEIGLWAYPEERDHLIAKLRVTGSLRDGLAHFRTKAGRVAPALWSADRIRLGDNEVILTTIHDISQQVEAQEKLRLSEGKYRLLAENVTDVIWTANLDLAFTYVSPSSERIFGWSPSEWMSKPLRDFLVPSSRETVERLVREEVARPGSARYAESRVITMEMEIYRKDGTTGWYEVSAQMIRDEDGTPRSIIGVTRDIAERKRAERQNALLEQQLRQAQKMEAVGTLAGGIAHDFNNILFAVIGYAELCLQDATNDESRWNLSQILSACNRAKTLVSQILAFSRQVEQERKPLDVVPLAREAVKFLRSSLPVTIDLHLDVPAANSVILADAAQVHQVLMNLCTNAAHAMRASGGRLAIRIDNASPPPGLVPEGDGARPAGFLRLSVSDTGHGIEPSRINRIFDPFFTTKAPGEGTGLGLSVVYGIVKALGGAIRVDSTPGRGSSFEIYLPSAAPQSQEPEKPPEPIPRGSESVLFVDDEGHLVEVMGQVLSALGYRVTTVRESRHALRLFRENPESFDLVITDMTMPDMTGAELAREILRFKPETPIILCTGYSELITEEEALRMGIRRFLMKPLFMGDVAREIRAVLEGSGRGTTA